MRVLRCASILLPLMSVAALAQPAPANTPDASATPGMPTTTSVGALPVNPPAAPFSMVDGNFLNSAVASNLALLVRAKLAQQQAQDDATRNLANTLVQDHTQLAQQLQTLSRQLGVQVPLVTDQQADHAAATLERRHGKDFSRAYLAQQETLLSRSVAQYQQELHASNNGPLRQYAQQTVLMLQSQLNQVRQLRQTVR